MRTSVRRIVLRRTEKLQKDTKIRNEKNTGTGTLVGYIMFEIEISPIDVGALFSSILGVPILKTNAVTGINFFHEPNLSMSIGSTSCAILFGISSFIIFQLMAPLSIYLSGCRGNRVL